MRIVTARDQYELAAPWREAAGGVKSLYRGLGQPHNPSHPLQSTDAPMGYSTFTDNPSLARQYAGDHGYVYRHDFPAHQETESFINDDGDRGLFYNNQKPAGLNGVSGNEYLVYHDHEDYDPAGMTLHEGPKAITAGARGETPPLQFEPFDTMWSNGIMARHGHDGRPVGHLHWHPDGEIDSITVHPDFQRQGIGSQMLRHAVDNPSTYESTWPIHASNHMTDAGRAFAKSHGHDPGDAEVTKADDDTGDWGWTAVKQYVPAHVPYRGQNEAEMEKHLTPGFNPGQSQPVVARRRIGAQGAWPKWWRGKSRPDVDWDKTWSPNHPDHQGMPWDSSSL